MISLSITILLLINFYYAYQFGGRNKNRIFGIAFGILFLGLYSYYLTYETEFELASTPANYKIINLRQKPINLFFIRFYSDSITVVNKGSIISPFEERNAPSFETEGATEIWIISINKNEIISIDKIKDSMSYPIVIKLVGETESLNSIDVKKVRKLLIQHKIHTVGKLLIASINLIMIIFLCLKRRKLTAHNIA